MEFKTRVLAFLRILASAWVGGALCLFPSNLVARPGQPGDFLNSGVTARAMGLANAYTSVVQDPAALFYNPAGLAWLPAVEASFTHAALYQASQFDYAGTGLPTRFGTVGLAALRLASDGGIGKDEFNSPTARFDYSENAFSLGWGWKNPFGIPGMAFGAGSSVLERRLASSSDRLLGIDLGAQYTPLAHERFHSALTLKNVFRGSSGDTSDQLPFRAVLGFSYRPLSGLLVALDLDDAKTVAFGAEYLWGPLSLRLGYSQQSSNAVLPFPVGGVGFQLKRIRFDYALANNSDLDQLSHRVTGTFRFGGDPRFTDVHGISNRYLMDFREQLEAGRYLEALLSFETAEKMMRPRPISSDDRGDYDSVQDLAGGLNLRKQAHARRAFSASTRSAQIARSAVGAWLARQNYRALLLAQAALGEDPRSPTLEAFLAFMEKKSGVRRNPEEILPFRKLVDRKLGEAKNAFLMKEYSLSELLCKQVLLLDPDNPVAYVRMGSVAYVIGDRKKALELYRRAQAINPNDPELNQFLREKFK